MTMTTENNASVAPSRVRVLDVVIVAGSTLVACGGFCARTIAMLLGGG